MPDSDKSTSPIRFGLIGYGAWGGHHAKAIDEVEGAELVAIAARSEESQKRAREDFPDAFVTGDYHEFVTREDVDVVDIVLPTHLHLEACLTAIEAKKHVLLEKPMAATIDDCHRIVSAAAEAGITLAVGHELRLSSQWGTLKEMVDHGDVGEVRYVLVELSRKPYRHGAEGWRYDLDRVGNWILEEPIHFFDLARWYLSGSGEPSNVYSTANACDASRPDLHDNFSAVMKYENGSYAVVSQTLAAFEHHQTVKVVGTDGALWAGWSGAMDRTERPEFFLKAMRGRDGEVETIDLDRPSGELFELRVEVARVAAAVRNGEPVPATGLDGLWSAGMCLAAVKSLQSGQPHDLTAFMAPYL
ncbi:MAG: Gfo/Idh/MocA family oxidoreductase [Verrucomicrobiota bacterium]